MAVEVEKLPTEVQQLGSGNTSELHGQSVEKSEEPKKLPDTESWEGTSENASYSLSIQAFNDGREDEVRGGTITALSVTEDDSLPDDNSSAMAYYMGREAVYVAVTHHDIVKLAEYNQSDRKGEAPDTYTFEAYHAPFPELNLDEDGEIGDGIYRAGDRLVYQRRDHSRTSTDERINTIDLPFSIDTDVRTFLHKDGKPNKAAESEHEEEYPAEGINLSEEAIPPKYSTNFYTSVLRNL